MGKSTKAAGSEKWWGVLLVAIVFLVYLPAWWAGFIWDDDVVIFANPVVAGPQGLTEIWTTSASDVCPLTLTTLWAEYKLWGAAPLPYHLVTLALHIANAVLLWRVLLQLRVPGAWFGALFWAIHPVEAESVAWASEMKNTESGLFFLLAILFFAKSIEGEGSKHAKAWQWYVISLVFAALAMMAKSSTVILPMVLVLCCVWIQGRWRWANVTKIAPILLFSIVAAINSMWTQGGHGSGDVGSDWTWADRCVQAGYNVWFYLGKLIFPFPLVLTYPPWQINMSSALSYLPSALVVVVSGMLWFWHKSWGAPYLYAWVFFVGALVPVLGFTSMMFFNKAPVADHFQYLASMGPMALVGAGVGAMSQKVVRELAAGILAVLLGILTFRQAWIDGQPETLWQNAVTWSDSWIAHDSFGYVLMAHGRNAEAIPHFTRATELVPSYAGSRTNLAWAYFRNGQFDRAAENYRIAIQIDPKDKTAHQGLGQTYSQMGNADGAIAEFRRLLELDPADFDSEDWLAHELQQKGRLDEAIAAFRQAIKIAPDRPEIHSNLGYALSQAGHLAEAADEFRAAIRLKPDYADAYNSLGIMLAQQGDIAGAREQFLAALRISPNMPAAKANLAQAEQTLHSKPPAHK